MFNRLPADVLRSLTRDPREAIGEALRKESEPGGGYEVDLRFSLPLPFGLYFVTLLAGRERRDAARRAWERACHALWT